MQSERLQPTRLDTSIKPYQVKAVGQLAQNHGAGLLLDPGMGKTAATLMAFNILKDAGLVDTMLVIAPIRPMGDTWPAEIQKWADLNHLTTSIMHGPKKYEALKAKADIYLMNPEGLKWFANVYQDMGSLPHVLCVDESTKFKSSTAKRSKILKKLLPHFRYRWILTGTFVPNGLLDMFGQTLLMDKGAALGEFVTHFKSRYGTVDEYRHKFIPNEGAYEEVAAKIEHMVLRLDAEDYLNMPDLQYVTRPVKLPDTAMHLYEQVQKDFLAEIRAGKYGGTIMAANQAAAGTKCRQMANGKCYRELTQEELLTKPNSRPYAHVHSEKSKELESLLDETSGNKMLIIYEFKHDLESIKECLKGHLKDGVKFAELTGQSRKNFTAAVNEFNTPGSDLRYVLAHSGSLHGINIQADCRHMVWYGITWNYENYKQAVTRLYRQGQKLTAPVMVYHIVAEGTLDEAVVQVLIDKEATQAMVEDMLKGQ